MSQYIDSIDTGCEIILERDTSRNMTLGLTPSATSV